MMARLAALPTRIIDSIGIALVLVIVGGTYVLGIHPTLDRRAAARQDAQTLATERAGAAAAAEELRTAEKALDAAQLLQSTALVLEQADQVNARIASLTSLATAESITIEQLTPGTAQAEPGRPFRRVPLRVQGSGAFAECIAFLARLRAEHRDIAVPGVNLSISQPASENQPARLSMTLDLVWYAAPDDPAARP